MSILNPEPMKPVGRKAQKQIPFPDGVNNDAELDLSVLTILQNTQNSKKRKATIGEVYFGFFGVPKQQQNQQNQDINNDGKKKKKKVRVRTSEKRSERKIEASAQNL